jgi:GNAT superfamily N-acetyltransferase
MKHLEYRIKSSTSRSRVDFLAMAEPFSDSVNDMERYSFFVSVEIYAFETDDNFEFSPDDGVLAATLEGIIFDENKIIDEEQDMTDIADMFDSDTEGAIYNLVNSEQYKRDIGADFLFTSLYSCYISKLYVEPDSRKKGIASYILDNLYDIFLHSFNTPIRCFVTFPDPQVYLRESNDIVARENAPDESEEMKKILISIIEKVGFKNINHTGFYAVNCMA